MAPSCRGHPNPADHPLQRKRHTSSTGRQIGPNGACGDLAELAGWCRDAGLAIVDTVTHPGVARFASTDDMVATEVEGSPLIERITDEVYARIRHDARDALAPFVTPAGTVEAPLVCHLVAATATAAPAG